MKTYIVSHDTLAYILRNIKKDTMVSDIKYGSTKEIAILYVEYLEEVERLEEERREKDQLQTYKRLKEKYENQSGEPKKKGRFWLYDFLPTDKQQDD